MLSPEERESLLAEARDVERREALREARKSGKITIPPRFVLRFLDHIHRLLGGRAVVPPRRPFKDSGKFKL
ncbi:MAG TPA: hypothetical protein VLW17_07760 [Thermoanaerobaculaceae bacterium]|nr:hypothetical protein [Thermoanaerobaculaceae bacterium]